MIKAVLFDLGGTILHYHDADEESLFAQGMAKLRQELVRRGHAAPEAETLRRRVARAIRLRAALHFFSERELNIEKILRHVLRRVRVRLKAGELDDLARAFWSAYAPHVGYFDDMVATLERLRKMGLKVGLISNTLWPAWILREELRRREHARLFDIMLFSPEVGFRKPSRRIFLRALRELGLKGREAAFVGDSPVEDVRGPQRVRMMTILKLPPKQRVRRSLHPDFTVRNLAEVPAIIEKVNAWGKTA